MKIIFETERLIIRQWKDEDYKDLYEYASDDETTKYLHFETYKNEQTAKDRIKFVKNEYLNNEMLGEFPIELKQEHKVIGAINIRLDTVKAGGIMIMGWVLNKNYRGKGYMTECVKEAFKYVKRNNLAKRIKATHDVDNYKSGNVMKRAGMVFEGISRKAGDNNFHSRYDVANYSILYEEIEI
ncbi:MAG: GNAT family N-acetyltransferase [Clostridia bacterium]|nr:GNAT family N-acetyltransferase [Clostridia bacterium]